MKCLSRQGVLKGFESLWNLERLNVSPGHSVNSLISWAMVRNLSDYQTTLNRQLKLAKFN